MSTYILGTWNGWWLYKGSMTIVHLPRKVNRPTLSISETMNWSRISKSYNYIYIYSEKYTHLLVEESEKYNKHYITLWKTNIAMKNGPELKMILYDFTLSYWKWEYSSHCYVSLPKGNLPYHNTIIPGNAKNSALVMHHFSGGTRWWNSMAFLTHRPLPGLNLGITKGETLQSTWKKHS